MFMKLHYEDGTERILRLPGSRSKIARISFPRPRRRDATVFDTTFRGLWITDTGIFVEVHHAAEAYILQGDGFRLLNATIKADGTVLVDGLKTCELVEIRRGTARKTDSGRNWPTVQKSGKPSSGDSAL